MFVFYTMIKNDNFGCEVHILICLFVFHSVIQRITNVFCLPYIMKFFCSITMWYATCYVFFLRFQSVTFVSFLIFLLLTDKKKRWTENFKETQNIYLYLFVASFYICSFSVNVVIVVIGMY